MHFYLFCWQFLMKLNKFVQPSEHFFMLNRWLFWKITLNSQKMPKNAKKWRHYDAITTQKSILCQNEWHNSIFLQISHKIKSFLSFHLAGIGQKWQKSWKNTVFQAFSYIFLYIGGQNQKTRYLALFHPLPNFFYNTKVVIWDVSDHISQ